MDIKVYIMQTSGVITFVEFTGVSDVRYEKANEHSGKPDVLTVLSKTEDTWEAYEVVAEFHRDDVVGWAKVEYLSPVEVGG